MVMSSQAAEPQPDRLVADADPGRDLPQAQAAGGQPEQRRVVHVGAVARGRAGSGVTPPVGWGILHNDDVARAEQVGFDDAGSNPLGTASAYFA